MSLALATLSKATKKPDQKASLTLRPETFSVEEKNDYYRLDSDVDVKHYDEWAWSEEYHRRYWRSVERRFQYFHRDKDGKYPVKLVRFSTLGLETLAKYHQTRSNIRIIFAAGYAEFFVQLKKLKDSAENMRVGFIVEMQANKHVTPIVYEQCKTAQEKLERRLYQFDSVPGAEAEQLEESNNPLVMLLDTAINKHTQHELFADTQIYIGRTGRQADFGTCRGDALFVLTQALQLANLRAAITCVVPTSTGIFVCEPPPQCLIATQKSGALKHLEKGFPKTYAVLNSHYTEHKIEFSQQLSYEGCSFSDDDDDFSTFNIFLKREGFFNVLRLNKALEAKKSDSETEALAQHELEISQITTAVVEAFKEDTNNLHTWLNEFFTFLEKCVGKDIAGTGIDVIKEKMAGWKDLRVLDDKFNLLKDIGDKVNHRLNSFCGFFSSFGRSPYVDRLYSNLGFYLRQIKHPGHLYALEWLNLKLKDLADADPHKFNVVVYRTTEFPKLLLTH